MAALCAPGIAVAVHVPRAEVREAAVLRRDPAQCRRLPAVSRRLSPPGCTPTTRQSGLAHPCGPPTEGRHACHLPALAYAGVVLKRGKCRNTVGVHWALSAGRDAANASQAGCDGRLRYQLLS